MSLEQALARTEEVANATLAVEKDVARCLKRFLKAAKVGLMKEIPKALEAAEQAAARLQAEIAKAQEGCNFDEASCWNDGSYVRELLEIAKQMGVDMYRQDDCLYCYPSLVRLLPNEQIVVIDKAREKSVRPSVLVEHLRRLQERPVRFRSDSFLESLHAAYEIAVKTRAKERRGKGTVVPLAEIYELLTLLPGQAREYSRHEFARDLYLLDDSGVRNTRRDTALHLHPARGTEPERKVFSTVAKDGRLLRYYGVSFPRQENSE